MCVCNYVTKTRVIFILYQGILVNSYVLCKVFLEYLEIKKKNVPL